MNNVMIELYGVAGCGKTTISEKIEDIIRNDKISCIIYADRYERYVKKRFWRFRLLSSVTPKKLTSLIFLYYKMYKSIHSRKMFDLKYCLFMCLNHLFCIKLYKSSSGIIICDEGIMQYLFSLFYDREIQKLNPIKDIINRYEMDFPTNIYCSIIADKETIINRIQNRNGFSRLDSERTDNIEFVVENQSRNMKIIHDLIDANRKFVFASSEQPEIVARKIYSCLNDCRFEYEQTD